MKAQIFSSLCLLALTACIYPVQHFEPGSASDVIANPGLHMDQNLLKEQSRRHQVLVAVVDGGMDYTHPGLARQLHLNSSGEGVGLDVLGKDVWPFPILVNPANGEIMEDFTGTNDHGTHVASLAALGGFLKTSAGSRLDAGSLIGIVPVRVLPMSDEGIPEEASEMEAQRHLAVKVVEVLKAAMEFASKEGTKVANFSLGMNAEEFKDQTGKEILVKKMKTELYPRFINEWGHILFVFAAGNETQEVVDGNYPASLKGKNLITVGALTKKMEIANYSNFGELVDVYIQGSDINGMIPNGKRDHMSGTSMATPLVSNLAAKVLLLAPCLAAHQVKELIVNESEILTLKVEDKEETKKVRVVDFQKTLQRAAQVCVWK